MVAVAEREFGTLDIVVNNAGLTKDSTLHRMSDETWDLVLDVALKGTFHVCRSAARLLRVKDADAQPQGRQHLVDQRHLRRRVQRELLGREGGRDRPDEGARPRVGAASDQRQRGRAGLRRDAAHVGPRRRATRFGMPAGAARAGATHQIPIGRAGQPDDVAGARRVALRARLPTTSPARSWRSTAASRS